MKCIWCNKETTLTHIENYEMPKFGSMDSGEKVIIPFVDVEKCECGEEYFSGTEADRVSKLCKELSEG